MKRLLAVFLAVALICGLGILAAGAEDPAFMAGYATVDITPEVGLPLAGYGDPTRVSTDNEGTLQVTCVALTDAADTTALWLSVDTYNTNQMWSNYAKNAIVEALGEQINIDRIYISATGTMSAPDMFYYGEDAQIGAKVDAYRQSVIDACATVAEAAMKDRCEATMAYGSVDASAVLAQQLSLEDGDPTTRLSYNAHYKVTDKNGNSWVAGNGFGPVGAINSTSYTVTEVSPPNDTLSLLRFVPTNGSAPIVMANWGAKVNLSSTATIKYGELNHTKASADYVGYFRAAMTGTRTAFFQGTSGNVAAFSLVKSTRDQQTNISETIAYTVEENGEQVEKTELSVTPQKYGQALAAVATYGLANSMTEKVAPTISNMKIRFATEPDVPPLEQVTLVNALKNTPYSGGGMDLDDENDGENLYANLYEYLLANWSEKTTYETTYPELENLVHQAELSGINTRMVHSVGTIANFATDAVYCDTTVLTLGDITFSMAPCDLYDNYGESDGQGGYTKTWANTGVDFAIGNTNGASGYLASNVSYTYNNHGLANNGTVYYQGTNITLTTAFPQGAGERLMETYANVRKTLQATEENLDNQIKIQCECGAQVTEFDTKELPGHVHEAKAFLPWYDPDSLPVDGNYYLKTDVRIYGEARTGVGHKCLDLNGYTITRVVLPEVVLDSTGVEIPENLFYTNTRLFAVESNARITVTDTSAEGTGTLTRDVSALDDYGTDENAKINNYGLLIAIIDGNVNENVVYKANLNAAGQVSGGGACVANMSYKEDDDGNVVYQATFTMYEGTLTGGISDRGTAVYANGQNNFYGGTFVAGTVADTTGDDDTIAQNNGSLYAVGRVLLAGDTTVTGGTDAEGRENNISVGGWNLTVDPDYTGTAGITCRNQDDPNGIIIGYKEKATDELLEAQFTVDNYPTYCVTTCESVIMVADIREYCICGGKAHGEHAHEQELVSWKPWPVSYRNYLPTASLGGNYYLLTDITLSEQKSVLATLHLDLNGHNITHNVNPNHETFPSNTRVFYVGTGGTLTITDSTTDPEKIGKITRDLSLLSEEQKEGITNYGLIILINQEADGDCILFDGILDATGQVSGGGACVANLTKNVYFRMYGGKLLGGIASTGGCLYSSGPVELHDGVITGGKATGATGAGGVAIVTLDPNADQGRLEKYIGSLSICGNVQITGNMDKNDQPSNIRVNPDYKNFKIVGNFTGNIGVTLLATPEHNMPVATGEGANLAGEGSITNDNYTDRCSLAIDNDYLVVRMAAAKIGETYYDTLQEAFTAYAGGNTVITLQRPVAEDNLEITQNTYLDLNGWDVTENTIFNTGENKLLVLDSETDDYTITAGELHYVYDEEQDDYVKTIGNGYGIMQGDIAQAAEGVPMDSDIDTAVKPTDLYLKIVEAGSGTSFHRLNLRFAGITLRPDSDPENGSYWPGLYYNSQFGGDEVIKRNIVTYGVGMSAIDGEEMFTRENSYTEISADNWQAGADASGNSKNLANGTILTGIMKATNASIINRRNGARAVRGQNYVTIGGERVVGPEISYSLKDVFEGNGMKGVDELWDTWPAATQTAILKLYTTYKHVMQDWTIPNIKAAQ